MYRNDYFIIRHDGERTSCKICITVMVNFSNNEESVNIIIYFLLLLKRLLKINSNVLHSSDSGLNGAIGKSGRGQRTWTRTTDVDTDRSGHSQVNSRGRRQEQVDSRRLTLHSADFERDCTLVQRHSSKYQTYCAFCDKSTKVGTYVE